VSGVKIEFRDGYNHGLNQIAFESTTLEEVIHKQLHRSDYYAGEIETMRGYVETLQLTIGSLVEILFAEKKLSGNQVCQILNLPKGSIKRIKVE
jgi:hypothetical protein